MRRFSGILIAAVFCFLSVSSSRGFAAITSSVKVQVLPFVGPTADSDAGKQRRAELIRALVSYGFYSVCPYIGLPGVDDTADATVKKLITPAPCAPAFLIRPTVSGNNQLSLQVFDVSDASGTATFQLTLGDINSSIDPNATALKPLANPRKDANGVPALSQPPYRFQQFIQLIPLGGDAALYTDQVIHMLAQRGLTARPSNFTSVTIAKSGPLAATATGGSSVCDAGQYYFTYSVNLRTDAKPLIGFTRVGASADGWLYDCNKGIMLGDIAGDDKRGVPTTKDTITAYSQILSALSLFSRVTFGPKLDAGLPLVASFIDVDPKNVDVRQRVGELALQRLVDQFCNAANTQYEDPAVQKALMDYHATIQSVSAASAAETDPTKKQSLAQDLSTLTTNFKALTNAAQTRTFSYLQSQNAVAQIADGSGDTPVGKAVTASTTAAAAVSADITSSQPGNQSNASGSAISADELVGPKPYRIGCNLGANNALHVDPVPLQPGLFEGWDPVPVRHAPEPQP